MGDTVKILVVDDEPRLRGAWQKILGMQPDMEFLGCLPSAEEIESHLPEDDDSVVLLDLTMPGRDSLSAVTDLSTARPRARVIIYSAHSDPSIVKRSYASGAWGFVDKLRPPAEILDIIRRASRGETAFPERLCK